MKIDYTEQKTKYTMYMYIIYYYYLVFKCNNY